MWQEIIGFKKKNLQRIVINNELVSTTALLMSLLIGKWHLYRDGKIVDIDTNLVPGALYM
jgi:hypothetical protein